ncbi:hypothetical protein MTR_1g072545 [Medicago truncatula]|uniref:Uncharacterized protein n=1 Tax=Medicago truncatula TaxID=3880 RepID=A0A072VMI3_MEDTR|nr:hypothetical protein MTR_1g072545 [Medicago truncatula]
MSGNSYLLVGYHDVCVCGRACSGDSGVPRHRQGMKERVEIGAEKLVILEFSSSYANTSQHESTLTFTPAP